MRYKRVVSIFCILVLLFTQNSISAFSVGGKNRKASADDETKTITLDDNFADMIKVTDKEYNNMVDAQLDFSFVNLYGVDDDDEVSLSADARFENPYAGEDKIVIVSDFKLAGRDKDNYTLELSDENMTVNLSGNITPKPIHVIPGNMGQLDKSKIEVPYLFSQWGVQEEDIIGGDTVNVFGNLYIVKDGEDYVYSVDDIRTDNYNYTVALQDGAVPDVIESEKVVIDECAVVVSNTEESFVLKNCGFGIVSDNSVKILVTTDLKPDVENLRIKLMEDDKQICDPINVQESEYEIIEDEFGDEWYRYVTEFVVNVPQREKGRILNNVICEAETDDNTAAAKKLLTFKLENSDKTANSIIIDNGAPAFDSTEKINVTYNNRDKYINVTGLVTDKYSGIASVEYKWDTESNKYILYKFDNYSSAEKEKIPKVNLNIRTKYSNLKVKPDDGRHVLYLKITDNAGRVTETNGIFCSENEGMDTKSPYVKKIELKSETDKLLDKIISVLTFGNYSRQNMKLTITAEDSSESKNVGGVKSVILKDGETKLDLESENAVDGEYEFIVSQEQEIENFNIELTDNYNNKQVVSVTEALKSYKADTEKDTDAAEAANWEMLQSDKWVLDKSRPTISVKYDSSVSSNGNIYYNQKGGSAVISVNDNFALKDFYIYQRNVDGSKETVYSKSYNSSAVTSDKYVINTNDLETGNHTFYVEVNDWAKNEKATQVLSFYVDHEPPTGSISVISPEAVSHNGDVWVNARDKNGDPQKVKLRLTPRSNGSALSRFVFNVNSKKFEFNSDSIQYDDDKKQYVEFELDPDEVPYDSNNLYTIKYEITTEAKNVYSDTFVLRMDTEDPAVNKLYVKKKNNTIEKILNVLSFGVFCNDAIILNADVSDGEHDSGINYVTIKYDGIDEPRTMKLENYGYEIELPEEIKVFQSNIEITVYDNVGNHMTASPQIQNTEKSSDVSEKCFVMLETAAPEISVDLKDGDGVKRNDGQIWYNKNKEFTVKVYDENSGIRDISVKVNGKSLSKDSNGTAVLNIDETSHKKDIISTAEYIFSTEKLAEKIKPNDDGSFKIEVYAVDNSGNVSDIVSKSYYIDNSNPNIVRFDFKPASEDGFDNTDKFVEELEYYYYFKKDFAATVTAEDDGYSSGFDKVEFRLVSYDNSEIVGEEKQEIIMNGSQAAITVPAGFKGMIYARVFDNTGNFSKELTPKAFVIDDSAPEINVEKLPDNNSKTDDLGNKLYTGPVRFKVTVTDTKSGLKNVSYSQSSDLNSHEPIVTEIDNNVDLDNTTALDNGWKIERTDANLITCVSKTFNFDKDDKNICLTFGAEDRSHNESDLISSEKFTIDTVSPVINKFTFEPADVNDISETDEFIEELEYGYFFKESFDLIVSVDDNKPSSGLDKTVFRLVNYTEDTEEEASESSDESDTKIERDNDSDLDTDSDIQSDKENSKVISEKDAPNTTVEEGEEEDTKKPVETTFTADIEDKKAVCRIPAGFKGQIFVQVFDRASNSSDEVTSKAFVVDNKTPNIIIEPLPDNKSKTDDMGNKLYTEKVQFRVTISDKQSGLSEIVFSKKSDLDTYDDVVTKVNDSNDDDTDNKKSDTENSRSTDEKNKDISAGDNDDTETDNENRLKNGWEIVEKDANLITEVSRIFTFEKDDKNIFMTFSAADNSKNDTGDIKSEKFTIDTTAPTVVKYNFEPASTDGISEVSEFIEELEYGYYFKREFNAIVTSEDKTPSSGLDKVVFRIVSYNNGEISSEELKEIPVEDTKAVYVVPAGFKGQIFAQAFDRAANHSEEETPQGFVSDEVAPVIKIDPLPNNNSKTDMNGNKLYTGTVDVRVTITDEKAGLRELVYSQSSEKDSFGNVVTSISNTDGYRDNKTLENGWIIDKTDKNLITEVSQVFSFSQDNNNIIMSFSAVDRSNNTSQTESSEIFTIDTTDPQVVISNSDVPINEKFYKNQTTFTITVTERNFDENLMISEIENSYTDYKPAVHFESTGENIYTAKVVFEEGDYVFNFTGEDRGGHKTEIRYDKSDFSTSTFTDEFNVDATAPVLESNINDFGDINDPSVYFMKTQNVSFTITEHNFNEEDMNVKVESKAAGTSHSNNDDGWYEIGYDAKWEPEDNSDVHTLKFELTENAVYRMSIEPSDRAGNKIEKISSAVFEIDTKPPEIYSRNGQNASDKGFVATPYYEVYDEKKKDDPVPVVSFDDLNFDRIEIEAVVYLPEYKNGMEYGEVLPDKLSDEISGSVNSKQYSLPNFSKDGVYALTYVAVDKAGNKSVPINDTYFKMVNTDVLAYLYHSNKAEHTGYYSLMSEDGKAISKKAANFQDLDIFVIKRKNDNSAGVVVLREDDKQYSPDDYLKEESEKISETAVLTKKHLPALYFSETFKDDNLDTRMYLSVSIHDNAYLDLASIHIDNEPPSASLPKDFVDWHNYMFVNEVNVEISDITETLNEEWCKVYECPRGQNRVEIPFVYNKEDKNLTFTLEKGGHNIDIILADEAGNKWSIDRVSHLRVGNLRLYLGAAAISVLTICIVTFHFLRKKRTTAVK